MPHVIRATPGQDCSGQSHRYDTALQLVYMLKGWFGFEYEGQARVRFDAGSRVYNPPNIRHLEVGRSDDVKTLEVVMPGGFTTQEVASVGALTGAAGLVPAMQ